MNRHMNCSRKRQKDKLKIAVEEQQIKQQKTKAPTRPVIGKVPGKHCLRVLARAAGSTVGRQIIRGIMGSLLGGRR